jgi:hypothetical protein
MKKLQQLTAILLLLVFTTTANAQLGSLLKKAKDKLTEKKPAAEPKKETAVQPPAQSKTEPAQKPEASDDDEESPKKDITKKMGSSKNNDANTPDGYFVVDNPLGKIYFDNKPFTANTTENKTTFKTSDYIYARLQLKSGTVKDALKILPKKEPTDFYSFNYIAVLYKNKKEVYSNQVAWHHCLLRDADLDKNYLDIDILPNPGNLQTIMAPLVDFANGKGPAPLYTAVQRQDFKEEGTYKVDIIIQNETVDVWGNREKEDKWPTFEADFDLNFSNADVAALIANDKKATENAAAAFEKIAAKSQPLHEGWSLKSGAPVASYSAAKYNQQYSKFYPTVKIVKTYMKPDNGWSVIKDNDNILPIYKYSSQWVTYFCKTTDGKCYYHTCNLRQNYEGGGRYGAAFLAVFDSEITYVDCEKMK